MNLFLPMTSLIGPIYFGIEGWPVGAVLIWAAIWTALRFLGTRKQISAVLLEDDEDEAPSWLDGHPHLLLLGAFLATLLVFAATHATIYWIVWELVHNSM
jgi:hypothetical protein